MTPFNSAPVQPRAAAAVASHSALYFSNFPQRKFGEYWREWVRRRYLYL